MTPPNFFFIMHKIQTGINILAMLTPVEVEINRLHRPIIQTIRIVKLKF